MLRRRENRGDIAQLDNLRAPHHRDAVTELGIDTQVVGDEQDGEVELVANVRE